MLKHFQNKVKQQLILIVYWLNWCNDESTSVFLYLAHNSLLVNVFQVTYKVRRVMENAYSMTNVLFMKTMAIDAIPYDNVANKLHGG